MTNLAWLQLSSGLKSESEPCEKNNLWTVFSFNSSHGLLKIQTLLLTFDLRMPKICHLFLPLWGRLALQKSRRASVFPFHIWRFFPSPSVSLLDHSLCQGSSCFSSSLSKSEAIHQILLRIFFGHLPPLLFTPLPPS